MSVLSFTTKIFPPPKYMTLPSVGVDISDNSLKYIQFERTKHTLSLQHYGSVAIPEGVVAQGTVSDPSKLSDVLRTIKKKCDNTEYIRVSLPEEHAYLFETTVEKGTPYDDIRGLLEFKLEENVPLSPRDAFFDYDIVEDKKTDLKISVAVYARETILSYHKACVDAGLVPLSFEVEAEAIARAVLRTGEEGTHMILDFGKNRTGIGIVKNGSLLYTSTVDVGARQLNGALHAQLGDRTEDELTKIKNERGLLKGGDDNNVYEAILPTISALRDEAQTRINYWNTHSELQDDEPIEKIILCGGSSNLAGLPEYLTEELGIETERADVWQNVFLFNKHVPPITKSHSYGYATAIGLALAPFMTEHS